MCVGVPVWVDILHSQTGGGYAISVKLWQSPCGHREEQLWKWKQTIGSRTKRKTDRTQNTMIAPEVLDTAIPKRIHSHNFLVLGANKLLSWLSWLWLGFLSTCKKKKKNDLSGRNKIGRQDIKRTTTTTTIQSYRDPAHKKYTCYSLSGTARILVPWI